MFLEMETWLKVLRTVGLNPVVEEGLHPKRRGGLQCCGSVS